MDEAFNAQYEGKENYFAYTRDVFEESRDLCLNVLNQSTKIDFKPTKCESGYFLPVDISAARDYIPEKYFRANENYEDDADTLVK